MASDRSLSLSEGMGEIFVKVGGEVGRCPFVYGRLEGVEEVGWYITLLAGAKGVSIEKC